MNQGLGNLPAKLDGKGSWFGWIFTNLLFGYVIYFIVGGVVYVGNIIANTDNQTDGLCRTERWISYFEWMTLWGFWPDPCDGITSQEDSTDSTDSDATKATKTSCKGSLGKWKKYDNADKGFLCAKEANDIFTDTIDENCVGWLSHTELATYWSIPFITALSIGYGYVFTKSTPTIATYIFWILIGTLVVSTVRSLSYGSKFDILPPDQPSPLLYITDKLNLSPADELKYSFMANKSDGTQCMVEGVMLGGGIHSQSDPATYTPNSSTCDAETLPL